MPDDDTQHDEGGAGGFDDNGELDRGDLTDPGTSLSPGEVIESIADASQPIPLHDLAALSGADNATAAALLGLWPRIEPPRRRELLASLQRLEDEDSTLDFDRVHLTALQ